MAAKLSQNYYPEILYKLYIVNTPVVFRALWAIIKTFIDKKTREKIAIFKSNKFKYFKEEIGKNLDFLTK
jgi:uncharacterized membrane protein